MLDIKEYSDINDCKILWESLWPKHCIFDLWEVRECFAKSFDRKIKFLVAEQDGHPAGLLPLTYIEESENYAFFPGETWMGKTWLEQNKIPALNPGVRRELLSCIPGKANLRYLEPEYIVGDLLTVETDEIGYILRPGHYGYSFESYLQEFSGKSRKKLAAEASCLDARGISYRHDHFPDVASLFRLNHDAFGESSYFGDPRFLSSFESLIAWLWDNRLLRITTVIIGDSIAAVDVGAIFNNGYTVLAGGTNPDFKGVAKLINFHHIEWAFRERLETVDFLCGDFGWKERFHLSPRPLYKIHSPDTTKAALITESSDAGLSLVR